MKQLLLLVLFITMTSCNSETICEREIEGATYIIKAEYGGYNRLRLYRHGFLSDDYIDTEWISHTRLTVEEMPTPYNSHTLLEVKAKKCIEKLFRQAKANEIVKNISYKIDCN